MMCLVDSSYQSGGNGESGALDREGQGASILDADLKNDNKIYGSPPIYILHLLTIISTIAELIARNVRINTIHYIPQTDGVSCCYMATIIKNTLFLYLHQLPALSCGRIYYVCNRTLKLMLTCSMDIDKSHLPYL